MDWRQKSQYYTTWEEFTAAHPDIDENNLAAMKPRFEAYQDKMFQTVMMYLF